MYLETTLKCEHDIKKIKGWRKNISKKQVLNNNFEVIRKEEKSQVSNPKL